MRTSGCVQGGEGIRSGGCVSYPVYCPCVGTACRCIIDCFATLIYGQCEFFCMNATIWKCRDNINNPGCGICHPIHNPCIRIARSGYRIIKGSRCNGQVQCIVLRTSCIINCGTCIHSGCRVGDSVDRPCIRTAGRSRCIG